jgi:hypothetical protein
MALWKGQSDSDTLLSFRGDCITYEVERLAAPIGHYRLTIGNLWAYRSSLATEDIFAILRVAHRLAQAPNDVARKKVVETEPLFRGTTAS